MGEHAGLMYYTIGQLGLELVANKVETMLHGLSKLMDVAGFLFCTSVLTIFVKFRKEAEMRQK